ncbi:phosphomethylpyrimidine synthase ThiC [Candidatus Desantisbacteria bacterium]|nr:phosphomethylpyrimidine synthase ThiC [Candidatus Desantisbacteria bacterium]
MVALAKKGIITPEIKAVSKFENIDPEKIMEGLSEGTIVIPGNPNHINLNKIAGIGKGLSTKVNANIGTSPVNCDIKKELIKLKYCIKYKADTVMDLSIGGDIKKIRRNFLKKCILPFGTVPMYQTAVETTVKRGSIDRMTKDDIFNTIEQQAQEGVDFMTLHCGIIKETVEKLKRNERLMGVVSRGGAFLVKWIEENGQENPLYQEYDRLLDIAHNYDITLSLGDGFRPGCLNDATDIAQVSELIILGELTKRARERNVQVIIEGPGHMAINEITANVMLQKKLTKGAPFYVLGPLVTDIAPGYDHITSAIGGAVAASAGADFLCYVTPMEHLSLPDEEGVKEGIIAARIAAHAADIAKNVPMALNWDREMSYYRKNLNWEAQAKFAIDPMKINNRKKIKKSANGKTPCSMCGEFCSMKIKI